MQTKNMLRKQYMRRNKIIQEPREPGKFDVLLKSQRQDIMHFIENCISSRRKRGCDDIFCNYHLKIQEKVFVFVCFVFLNENRQNKRGM